MRKTYTRRSEMEAESARRLDADYFQWAHEEEALRGAVRRELRTHAGQRRLSRLIGVARGTLRKFVEMRSMPRAENRARIEHWAQDRPDYVPALGSVALALLVADLPAAERLAGRRALAAELAQVYQRAGLRAPEWLAEELESDE